VGGQRISRQSVNADTKADSQPCRRQLLHDLEVNLVRLPATAVLLRIGQPEHGGSTQRQEGITREAVRLLAFGGSRRQLSGGKLVSKLE
jgi:hypothetical protein